MIKKIYPALLLVIVLSGQALAAEHEIGQKNKEFSQASITVAKGDSISFINNDPFFHNIFSLSEVQAFDLGSYPQGKSRSVVFNNVGVVNIECAIHPAMQLEVTVE